MRLSKVLATPGLQGGFQVVYTLGKAIPGQHLEQKRHHLTKTSKKTEKKRVKMRGNA